MVSVLVVVVVKQNVMVAWRLVQLELWKGKRV
jgi:hypothetical protein